MSEKEVKEILELLEKAGWEPQLCDTPLPAYESVHAGNPMDPGQVPSDMIMLPRAFLSACPESMIRVQGNSMQDAGISDGDGVKMTIGQEPRDGDIVVVAIGLECTVKSYYEDDNGVRWLIPQNKAEEGMHDVICLDDTQERVYLCGVVKEILKELPRVSTRSMRNTLNALRSKDREEEPRISEQRVDEVIRLMAPEVKIGRQWYAVYKPLEEKKVYGKEDYVAFCDRVRQEVPEHKHLPVEVEMQRMAVQSFKKPVRQWNPNDAPVQGKRFVAYQKIGLQTLGLLETEG